MSEIYQQNYKLVTANLKILKDSHFNSLIIVSKAGLGKTTLVLKSLNELGLKEAEHYSYFNSYFTPLAFFLTLKEVNDTLKMPKYLILDDVEAILQDKNVVNLLKAATWQNMKDKRYITYVSSKLKPDDKTLDFRGKIILLLNELPKKNPCFDAILDRSLVVEFNFSNSQILELMEQEIVPKQYLNLSATDRFKVFNYLKKVVGIKHHYMPELSFRTLIKAYNFFLHSPNHWQELIENSITKPKSYDTSKNNTQLSL